MKLTNRKNYPAIVVNALKHVSDKYSKGEGVDISVTELISPPLMRILKKRHYDEITEDVEDRMFSFFGSLAHEFIENIDSPDVLFKEQRVLIEVGGWILSGQFDLIYKDKDEIILADIKFTSKYAVKDGCKTEWARQLNIYRYMIMSLKDHHSKLKNKIHEQIESIDRMEIIAPIRDATFLDDKLVVLPVKKFKDYKVKEYIEKRIALHKLCEDEITGKIPECTPEDRWQDSTKYAVCPGAGKKSLKNHDTRVQAEAHASTKENLVVEVRPQENKRCSRFCSVSRFCWWWTDYNEGYITDSYTGDIPVRRKYK